MAYAYTAVVFLALPFMLTAGDRWWTATMLLFGPRWLLSFPLFLLVPAAAIFNRRLLLPLVIAALVIAGPLMRFNLPLGKMSVAASSWTQNLRVLTCNVDQAVFDRAQFVAVIKELSVDIATLQEYPPALTIALPAGWNIVRDNQYAIISRFPLTKVKTVQIMHPKEKWAFTFLLHAIVHTPNGDVNVCSLQLPTPRVGLMQILDKRTGLRPSRSGLFYDETAYRRNAALEARRYIDTLARPVIVAGDFNTPVDSTLYRSVWDGYSNAFSEVGLGYGWTQRVAVLGYTYRARIDHILTQKGLTPLVCEVGPDVGSDHLPVIADFRMEKVPSPR